MPESMVCF
jgi:hypothetical protein